VAILLLLAALWLFSPAVLAQSAGTIAGTVRDSTGAVVPGADITLTNQATQAEFRTVSNDEGYFAFAAVLTGTYTVRVEMAGFKPWAFTGITMNPGDRRNLPEIKLQVGDVSSEVIVSAVVGEITPVDTGERSSVLNSKQIGNLSLMGRDATELIKIMPGMSVFTGGGIGNQAGYDPSVVGISSAVGNGYVANGTSNRGGMDLIQDGAHIIDPGCNCSATASVNADMVEEVKVQTSNYGADSVKGPVVITAVGKSGGSEYHGQAYLHTRDSKFNSMDWFLKKQGGEKPKDRYLYPGINFGGPVRLPWLNFNSDKKLLFWAGYEYYYQKLPAGSPITSNVPTVGMRSGDFTMAGEGNAAACPGGFSDSNWGKPMCGNLNGNLPNGKPIVGNIIPANMIDPGGAAIMKLFPLPNADPSKTGGFNYFKQFVTNQNGNIFRTRVDYDLSDNTKLYVSYQRQGQTSEVPVQLWWIANPAAPYPGGMSSGDRSHSISGNFVHVFSPTLTNEFIATWAYLDSPLSPNDPSLVSRSNLGYPYAGVYGNEVQYMPAVMNAWWSASLGYPHVYQPDMFEPNGVNTLTKKIPTFQNNLTKVLSTHTMKFGVYVEQTGNYQGSWGYPNGQVSFGTGPWTTAAHSEGLGTFNPVGNILLGVASGYSEANYNSIAYMAFKTIGGYLQDSWKVNNRLTLDLGLRFDHFGPWYDTKGVGMAAWFPDRYAKDVADGKEMPGIYWHARDASVPVGGIEAKLALVSPRLGFAWDISGQGTTVIRGGWGTYRWHDSWNAYGDALYTSLGSRSYSIPNTMYLSEIDQIKSTSSGTLGGLVSGANAVDPTDQTQPLTYTYNLTISRRLPGKSLLEVAYVGNKSENLYLEDKLANINLIPMGALFQPDPVTGAAPNPEGANLANYRPYRAYGNNSVKVFKHGAYSNYNALQLSWNKQSGRLNYTLNYTWSKTLGIGGTAQLGGTVGNPFDLRSNYGVLSQDRSHVFNTSYMFEVGNLYHGNPVLAGVTNGWTIAGISTWQSGPNIQSLWNANFGFGGGGGATLNSTTHLGTPDITLQPILVGDPTSGLKEHQFINGAAFSVPAVGQNGPYRLPYYLHGPAYFNSDLSLYKSFKVAEGHSLQLRFSGFNFLNHPLVSFNQNGMTNLTFSQPTPGQWALAAPDFGYANIKLGRRVLELALKYSF